LQHPKLLLTLGVHAQNRRQVRKKKRCTFFIAHEVVCKLEEFSFRLIGVKSLFFVEIYMKLYL